MDKWVKRETHRTLNELRTWVKDEEEDATRMREKIKIT
jgi:hypothetical protein